MTSNAGRARRDLRWMRWLDHYPWTVTIPYGYVCPQRERRYRRRPDGTHTRLWAGENPDLLHFHRPRT